MKRYFDYQTEGNKTKSISVEVRYSKGGYNNFTGQQEERGIWLILRPVTLTKTILDGKECTTEQYMAFSGNKVCLKELTRKSDKQLKQIAFKIEPVVEKLATLFRENKFDDLNEEINHAMVM